jgi:Kef-type K+ transport system membrane component KefB
VPAVVVEILLGVLIGPVVLGLVRESEVVASLSDLGLAFLMFVAGYEIELSQRSSPPGLRASDSASSPRLLSS